MTPEEFLTRFWSFNEPPQGGYHLTSIKNDTWEDYAHQAPFKPTQEELGGHDNLFFTPTPFSGPRRLGKYAGGKSPWLYADLDEVNPEYLDIKPQIAWETSPGRYQCAWRLDLALGPRAQERLNKAMTYHCQADRGGWSWTKALRVPASVSQKRDLPTPVTLLWADWEATLDASYVRGIVKDALPDLDVASGPIHLPKATAREIKRERWQVFSPRLRKLLNKRTLHPDDDRSARLWEIYNLALAAGCSPGEVVRIAQASIFNKYKGQRRELRRLMEEVNRAIVHTAQKAREVPDPKKPEPVDREPMELPQEVETDEGGQRPLVGHGKSLKPLSFKKFMAKSFPEPGWLVEHIWGKNAFGLWVGQEKAYKTTTVLDLAVSVASGTPFLGRFKVKHPGRVLYLHNEGNPGHVQAMFHRLTSQRGFAPTDETDESGNHSITSWGTPLDLDVESLTGFDLSDQDDRDYLLNYCRLYRPRLIILESWYVLARGIDENSAQEVGPIVEWLLNLAAHEQTAVILSHHLRKNVGDKGMDNDYVSGSGVFGRAFESKFQIVRTGEEEENLATFQTKHRHEMGKEHTIQVKFNRDMPEDFNLTFPAPKIAIPDGAKAHDVSTGRSYKKPNVLKPLHQGISGMIAGEFISLVQAAEHQGCTVEAMRSRIKREPDYEMDRDKGQAVIRKI